MTDATNTSSLIGETIASIRGTRRDPERRLIRVGKVVVATLERREVERLGLAEGVRYTCELSDAIDRAKTSDRLKRYAMNALAQRAMSEGELHQRLVRRGADESACARIIARLRELGLIDDEAYARSIAQSVIASRPAGARLLETKLRERRIDPEAARRVAAEALESRDAVQDACALAQRKARAMPPALPTQTKRRRVYGLLARRGFDAETCAEATRQVLSSHSEAGEGEFPAE